MTQTSLAELESRFGRREAVVLPWLIGAIAAIALPFIVITIGWMIELLIWASVAKSLPETIQLGPRLCLSTDWLDAGQGPLRGVLALMALAFGLAVVEALALHMLYRWAVHYSLDTEIWLRRTIYEKNFSLASIQGVVGQQAAQIEATTHWLPQVRDGLLAWHRTVPRHLIQAFVCFLFAVFVHPVLMVLAAVAFVLLWRIYGLIDGRRRRFRPVLAERIHSAKSRLTAMDECGPIISSVHPEKIVREIFESYLRSLRDAEFKLYDCTLWKAPFLLVAVAWMLCLFCFALSVRILQENAGLGVSGALSLLVLIGFGYLSILKIEKARGPIRNANQAASRLLVLLNQSEFEVTSSAKTSAVPLKEHLKFDRVSFADTLGQTLIKDISFQASPGMLVALLATSGLEAKVVGEMILGFGKPSIGTVRWDDKDASSFVGNSIQKHCLSVSPDGPMISGTLLENLSNFDSPGSITEIIDAVKIVGVYDAVDQLPDSLATLISPNDDRLKNDALYQLGIARAILRKSSVVVAQEPSERVAAAIESQSVAALRQLTRQGSIVFVIPQRLSALRHADLVVLFHDHRVASIGTHVELLGQSELYRHLNYVRFSNLKDVMIG